MKLGFYIGKAKGPPPSPLKCTPDFNNCRVVYCMYSVMFINMELHVHVLRVYIYII